MKQIYYVILSLALFGGLLMSGCTPVGSIQATPTASAAQPTRPAGAAQTPAPANTNTNLANPASVNCEQKGNRLEIRTAADGSQSGYCIFPDGTECEEWAFFRGECSQGTLAPAVTASPTETVPAATDTPEASAGPVLTATPEQNVTIDPALQKKIVGAAQIRLVKKLNVKASEIKLVSIAPVSWPDSCLGLPGPDEMCAEMITGGYRVVLSVNGQNYTFRTDQTGQNIRQEP
jgi:putative hemolysin